ncbi:hypothetical protein [Taylorella asinigenitalis]|uniref:Uncharacterized protein n=1 Tax=Taylorella asinigenitalis (strain MCE3) TaxID=1008459 RepID=G4QBC8_TAYAM|nr:hypothetical protein [Taylorella asinigenitalis]AEP36749.1 hypothetical protein TASI_0988 [Taylorella asinigenitalis MCE3]
MKDSIQSLVLIESQYIDLLQNTETFLILDLVRGSINKVLHLSIDEKDISLILNNEYQIIKNDFEKHANTKIMKSSLKEALFDLKIINENLNCVKNKSDYKIVNEAYQKPKNRKNGLPYDEARQSIASHKSRLENLLKSKSSKSEKIILKSRINGIEVIHDMYKILQSKALD